MAEKIRVFVCEDNQPLGVLAIRSTYQELDVVGCETSISHALTMIKIIRPDIVVIEIGERSAEIIQMTEHITTEYPGIGVILCHSSHDQELVRKAMMAGAKDYLVMPFSSDELLKAIRLAFELEKRRTNALESWNKASSPGQIITIFSAKGGVGKTTISINLAVAMASILKQPVGLVDFDLLFGNVPMHLNIRPRNDIVDLIQDIDRLDNNLLEPYLSSYEDKVKVLAAPIRPERTDEVTDKHIPLILHAMRNAFPFTIVDTAPSFNEVMLSILTASDYILIVLTLDLVAIRSVKRGIEILDSLHIPAEKIKLILNRANSDCGIVMKEVEEKLGFNFFATIPSDGRTVVGAANRGVPFVSSYPQSQVSKSVLSLAELVCDKKWTEEPETSILQKIKRMLS